MLFRSGTFLVNSVPATVLFDSGATHSFVTESFVSKGGLEGTLMRKPMMIQIPGSHSKAHKSCKDTPINIHGVDFLSDLVILGAQGIDVILSMDWLAKYHGQIDYARSAVAITSSGGVEVEYVSVSSPRQAFCHEGIAKPSLDEIRVVYRFPDVFPKELPGMPLDRDIEFVIELIPGTTPIS